MAFMEFLVHWSVFDDVEVGFLPVSHTHIDVDQTMSTTSRLLKTHDTITLADMHHDLSQCFDELTEFSNMDRCINWSSLCDIFKCLHSLNNIIAYQFFRFTRASTINGVICHMRGTVNDQ